MQDVYRNGALLYSCGCLDGIITLLVILSLKFLENFRQMQNWFEIRKQKVALEHPEVGIQILSLTFLYQIITHISNE